MRIPCMVSQSVRSFRAVLSDSAALNASHRGIEARLVRQTQTRRTSFPLRIAATQALQLPSINLSFQRVSFRHNSLTL